MRAARKDDPAHHPDLALPDPLLPQLEVPAPDPLSLEDEPESPWSELLPEGEEKYDSEEDVEEEP